MRRAADEYHVSNAVRETRKEEVELSRRELASESVTDKDKRWEAHAALVAPREDGNRLHKVTMEALNVVVKPLFVALCISRRAPGTVSGSDDMKLNAAEESQWAVVVSTAKDLIKEWRGPMPTVTGGDPTLRKHMGPPVEDDAMSLQTMSTNTSLLFGPWARTILELCFKAFRNEVSEQRVQEFTAKLCESRST